MTVVSTSQGPGPPQENQDRHRPDLTISICRTPTIPHPKIIPIFGILSYESITDVYIKLNLTAKSVHSELGNGALGLLALTVTPEVYNALAGVPLVTPLDPGKTLVIPPGSTGPMIAALDAAQDPSSYLEGVLGGR